MIFHSHAQCQQKNGLLNSGGLNSKISYDLWKIKIFYSAIYENGTKHKRKWSCCWIWFLGFVSEMVRFTSDIPSAKRHSLFIIILPLASSVHWNMDYCADSLENKDVSWIQKCMFSVWVISHKEKWICYISLGWLIWTTGNEERQEFRLGTRNEKKMAEKKPLFIIERSYRTANKKIQQYFDQFQMKIHWLIEHIFVYLVNQHQSAAKINRSMSMQTKANFIRKLCL